MINEGLDYLGRPLPRFVEPIRAPIVFTPIRLPRSVRRTMSIDVTWPGGPEGRGHYAGRARDIVTRAAGDDPHVLRESSLLAAADARTIVSAVSDPSLSALRHLPGVRAGSPLREILEKFFRDEKARGTPLYLLLDDLAGATMVAPWAFFAWNDRWPGVSPDAIAAQRKKMVGVCLGFAPGSSAFDGPGADQENENRVKVAPLIRSDDVGGWHALTECPGVTFRRARRIDVWRDNGTIQIDSAFQDSARVPDGSRMAVHEYAVRATADAGSLKLLSVNAIPGVLPFPECRAAPVNLAGLLGTPLGELREIVFEKLAKTAGCTHLNDMTRALAEVPILARDLPVD